MEDPTLVPGHREFDQANNRVLCLLSACGHGLNKKGPCHEEGSRDITDSGGSQGGLLSER